MVVNKSSGQALLSLLLVHEGCNNKFYGSFEEQGAGRGSGKVQMEGRERMISEWQEMKSHVMPTAPAESRETKRNIHASMILLE